MRGEPRVIHGLINGQLQILNLADAFLSFSGIISDQVVLPHMHKAPITCLYVEEGGGSSSLLISGDARGVLGFWDLSEINSPLLLNRQSQHSSLIVGMIRIGVNRLLVVDEVGRVSLVDLAKRKFETFLGTRRVPIRSIRWGIPESAENSFKIALNFTDGRVQIWNMNLAESSPIVGHCEKECNATLPGLEETMQVLSGYVELPGNAPFSTPPGAAGVSLLRTGLNWRPGRPEDPVQTALLDVRKLIDAIRNSLTNASGKREGKKDQEVKMTISLVLSLLLPWGIDAEVDTWAHRLGFGRRRRDVVPGIAGANGNVAFIGPTRSCGWSLSGTMCAALYLAVAAIFELPLELGEEWDRLRITFAQRLLQNGIACSTTSSEPILPLPSFSFASKYWHDLGEEIRHGSRLLIVQTLARMDSRQLHQIIDYWTALLPSNETSDARKMNRAAIILGIVGVHRTELLSSKIRKLVAESLMALLVDEKRNLFRAAAIELIGKAYSIWEPYVHALSVFRLLLGWLAGMSQIDESGPVAQLVVPFESAATLDTLDSVRGTLLKLAAATPHSILPLWLAQDFVAARTTIEKWTTISLLSDLVRQRPRPLRPYIPLLSETACRLIEGGSLVGSTKQRMLAIAMPLVSDLVHAFPTVAYHRETFRLAAAAPIDDIRIILVDMRGSAAMRIFEGHSRPVTALAFSSDGRLLVSYSLEEATLRWWNVPLGLIGLLSSAVKPFRTDVVEPALSEAVRTHMANLTDDSIEMIEMRWADDRSLQIAVCDSVVSVVPVPNP